MNRLVYFLPVLCLTGCVSDNSEKRLTGFVDPFIGTAYVGHTHPAASLPFSMVQVGPDTGIDGWEHCSGYRDTDRSVMGFSHTHLSGTGAAEMGDIMIMPVVGDILFDAGTAENPDAGYRSRFRQENEVARPGYYKTLLDDYRIQAEMTLKPRTGFHRYLFPASDKAGILLDMAHGIGDDTYESFIRAVDDSTIVGVRKSNGFTRDHAYYFAARFSKPFGQTVVWQDSVVTESRQAEGVKTKMHIRFNTSEGEAVLVKVGLSTTGVDGALNNVDTEIAGWDFERIRKEADRTWNDYLSRIAIEPTGDQQKISFYTSLYHALLMPNLVTDVDGKYTGWDKELHQSVDGEMYTNFSLWDTYRALHPFLSLLYPAENSRFVKSMLERHKQTGLLPTNEYGLCETWCMIGNHAVPVIVDAYLKGDTSFSPEAAYEAIRHAQTAEHMKADWSNYDKYGYFPFDLSASESVSRTLESGYDDYCVALMAKALGKEEDYQFFMNRAGFYKNLYDPSLMLVRGRDSKGRWRTPFHSFSLTSESQGGDYTEGNAWQWTWHIQHDIPGLIGLFGSKEAFVTKLDSLFFINVDELPGIVEVPDVTGLIGLYAHGNEPSHHIAYVYAYADRPDKTAEIIREIFDKYYLPTRDGLCGNDDCGQMSAWYIFSGMGFYPVDPVSGEYVLGAPQIPRVTLSLPNGNTFTVVANGLSETNKYVRSIRLNGQPVTRKSLRYEEVMNGGILEFDMDGKEDLTRYVDPFIGTAYVGHTHPAAQLPFGMVQVGPDTGTDRWEHCSGYFDEDASIIGFSHTHLSGTGCPDMGDILFMPVTGEPSFDRGDETNTATGYRSAFSHDTEEARPGYYKVRLDDYGI
ncbi:MAG: GH92 family glycosyl hydrolase, partial [Tannerellaceae bacterium]|nr:GH92 family glycosyl hydrolase [Tannerellaceae bacterium]